MIDVVSARVNWYPVRPLPLNQRLQTHRHYSLSQACTMYVRTISCVPHLCVFSRLPVRGLRYGSARSPALRGSSGAWRRRRREAPKSPEHPGVSLPIGGGGGGSGCGGGCGGGCGSNHDGGVMIDDRGVNNLSKVVCTKSELLQNTLPHTQHTRKHTCINTHAYMHTRAHA